MTLTILKSVPSTNSYMKVRADDFAHGDALVALEQTAGRGQRGNCWEAAPGLNISMSVMLRPGLRIERSYDISMAAALAVRSVVDDCLGSVYEVCVKWPNDIYVGDKKIAGILIENSLAGPIVVESIVGIGLNVNQTEFFSDAPNPVSIKQLTGTDNDIQLLADKIAIRLDDMLNITTDDSDAETMRNRYRDCLWRRSGSYRWLDKIKNEEILAEIYAVAPTGQLSLRLSDGSIRQYWFKEVEALL